MPNPALALHNRAWLNARLMARAIPKPPRLECVVERRAVGNLSGPGLLRERARLWARKEAWLKMTGEGLRADPSAVDVLDKPGITDLDPADTGLPGAFVAAVALDG